ncbi:MAG: FixG Ig-like domain-containing protein, partial [Bacteroidales bacterium]|nr:FixG Ig-like domain-containing protein [Bacteroidales bacterium]
KLNRQKWNFEKIWKKSLKHIIFFGIAFIISNTFLAYIVGTDRLLELVTDGPLAHLGSFIALLLFSGAFYFIFAFFREQVCIIACPYGRLQGVLLDNKSIVVAYDYLRGEPKGKHNPLENRQTSGKGDCIDCNSCVTVCPTGIDIRNGTQLECINCTACMDACDTIMEKVKLPKGLIRYASEKSIAEGIGKIFNARSIAYSVFLTILLSIVVSVFILRTDIESTILRVPGTLFQQYGNDSFSNVYKVQLVNKTRAALPVELRMVSHEGKIIIMGDPIVVDGGKMSEANFLIVMPKNILTSSSTPVEIGIYAGDLLIDKTKATFIAPNILDD